MLGSFKFLAPHFFSYQTSCAVTVQYMPKTIRIVKNTASTAPGSLRYVAMRYIPRMHAPQRLLPWCINQSGMKIRIAKTIILIFPYCVFFLTFLLSHKCFAVYRRASRNREPSGEERERSSGFPVRFTDREFPRFRENPNRGKNPRNARPENGGLGREFKINRAGNSHFPPRCEFVPRIRLSPSKLRGFSYSPRL